MKIVNDCLEDVYSNAAAESMKLEAKKPKKQIESKPQESEEEEMPDLNDPEVVKSSLAIQKAYLKKKNKQKHEPVGKKKEETKETKQKSSRNEIKEPKTQAKAQKEEEEMPDLSDPEVVKSSLAIQKAYLKKKNSKRMKVRARKKMRLFKSPK